MLRSKLPSNLIEAALEVDEDILTEESGDADNGLPEEDTVHPSGALIAYKEPGLAGVLYVILALVLVSGRCIGDGTLSCPSNALCRLDSLFPQPSYDPISRSFAYPLSPCLPILPPAPLR